MQSASACVRQAAEKYLYCEIRADVEFPLLVGAAGYDGAAGEQEYDREQLY